MVYHRAEYNEGRHTLVSSPPLLLPLSLRLNQLTRLFHRIFTFNVIVGSLTILFLILILVLASQRLLIPGIILLGSFILFVLWLTALIETSIQLFGAGNVNGNCQQFVQDEKFTGISVETLAWLTQNTICEWILFFFYISSFPNAGGPQISTLKRARLSIRRTLN